MKFKANRVTVDKKNRLVLVSVRDADNKNFEKIEKIEIDGKWELSSSHNLVFHVLSSEYTHLNFDKLIFKGTILDPKGDSFSFRITEYDNIEGKKNTSITLAGKWRLDKEQRITFKATKAESKYDTFTFNSAWKVSEKNEILYKYKKTELKRKDKQEHLVTIKGNWDIYKNKLRYQISASNRSYFDIKAEFASRTIKAGSNKMKFKLGTEYERHAGSKGISKDFTLNGKWNIDKHFNVSFSLGKIFEKNKSLDFGIEKMIFEKGKLGVLLSTRKGEKLGVKVEFYKQFSNDIDLFVKLASSGKEAKIIGGLEIKF